MHAETRLLYQTLSETELTRKPEEAIVRVEGALNDANFGRSPLMDASHHGNLEYVTIILKYFLVNQQDFLGWSALHFAVKAGHVAVVNALIAAGANVNLQTGSGLTPLFLGCDLPNDRLTITTALLDAGANANHCCEAVDESVLMFRILCQDFEGAQCLIERAKVKVNINWMNSSGETALTYLIRGGLTRFDDRCKFFLEFLLYHGALYQEHCRIGAADIARGELLRCCPVMVDLIDKHMAVRAGAGAGAGASGSLESTVWRGAVSAGAMGGAVGEPGLDGSAHL